MVLQRPCLSVGAAAAVLCGWLFVGIPRLKVGNISLPAAGCFCLARCCSYCMGVQNRHILWQSLCRKPVVTEMKIASGCLIYRATWRLYGCESSDVGSCDSDLCIRCGGDKNDLFEVDTTESVCFLELFEPCWLWVPLRSFNVILVPMRLKASSYSVT